MRAHRPVAHRRHGGELQRRQRAADDARVPAFQVGAMRRRVRIALRRGVRIARHGPERQRPGLVRAGRVRIHLLAVADAVQQERARPAGRQRRHRVGVERQRQRVARTRDDEEVVGGAEQLADVALARVAARHQLPRHDRRDAVVVVAVRLAAVRRDLRREAAPAQIGLRGVERRQPRLSRRDPTSRPGRDPSRRACSSRCRTSRAPAKRSRRQVDDDRLRPADRDRRSRRSRSASGRWRRGPAATADRAAGRPGARRRCRSRTRSRSSR